QASQQQIHLVVRFLFHSVKERKRRDTLQSKLRHKAHKSTIETPQTPSRVNSASTSVSILCATSANDFSVSACVQPLSSIKIFATRLRKSVCIRANLRLAVASCTPSTAPASRRRRLSK